MFIYPASAAKHNKRMWNESNVGNPLLQAQDVSAYFKVNHDRHNMFIHHLLHEHGGFDKQSGSLKSLYQFVQMIYRLSYII